MERVRLDNFPIVSAGYDPEAEVLEIEFRRGALYQYFEVPQGVYDWLMRVPNKGEYLENMIKDVYRFENVTPAPAPGIPLEEALAASLAALPKGPQSGDGSA